MMLNLLQRRENLKQSFWLKNLKQMLTKKKLLQPKQRPKLNSKEILLKREHLEPRCKLKLPKPNKISKLLG